MLEGLIPELRPLPGVTDPSKAPFRFAAFGASGRFLYGGANSLEDAKRAAEAAFGELGQDGRSAYASDERDPSECFLLVRLNEPWLKRSSRR